MSERVSPGSKTDNILREVLFIFFANKRVVIDTFLLIFVIVLAVAFLSPKEYTAKSTLMVKGKPLDRNPAVVQQLQSSFQDITREDLNSEAEIIGSVEVIKATILRLSKETDIFSLYLNPETGLPINEFNEERLTQFATKVAKKLDVTLVRTSQILELTLVWDDPDDAKVILNTVIEEYLRYRSAVYQPEKAKGFYNDTLNSYQSLLNENSQKILELTTKIKAPSSAVEIESNLEVSEGFQLQLGGLVVERSELRADLTYFRQQLKKVDELEGRGYVFFTNVENQSIREMSNSVRLKLHEYRSINSHFNETSHRARRKKEELDKAYANFIAEIRSVVEHKSKQLEAVEENINQLNDKISKLENRNVNLAQYQVQLDELITRKSLLEESFINYYRLHEESKMQERTRNAAIDTQIIILTKTWANKDATFPNKRLLIPFGFVIAVIIGLTVGFINEYFDNTFKRPVDTEFHLDLPMIISLSDKSPQPQKMFVHRLYDRVRDVFPKPKKVSKLKGK